MCNQIGKSTENILMRCAVLCCENRVQMLMWIVQPLNVVEWQRTHIKTSGVLYIHTHSQIKTTLNWTTSDRNIYYANEYCKYTMDSITMGKEWMRGGERENESNGTRLFWTRPFLFVWVSSITHLFYSIFFSISSDQVLFYAEVLVLCLCCCCYCYCCHCLCRRCSSFWNVKKAVSCC